MAQKKKSTPRSAPRKPAARKTAASRKSARPRRKQAEPVEVEPVESFSSRAPFAESAPVAESESPLPPAEVPQDSAVEAEFAGRMPPPAPERPRPLNRRAIFFDVENTSRAQDVSKILDHVAIDRIAMATELVASGNWRVIGNETARLLAKAGAHLVHSAPATGVRDWSDLRIAVAAGVWLASARPGDQIDIVSDDKAFDVVGDVAATLGVQFRRLSYRALLRGGAATGREEQPSRGGGRRERGAGAPSRPERAAAPARAEGERGGRRSRGGRGRGRGAARAETATPVPEAVPTAAAETSQLSLITTEPPAAEPAVASGGAPLAAPDAQLSELVHDLLQRSPQGVMLDVVANRLKALGFERPPGSPRLVTRVRSLPGIDVSPRGLVRAKGGAVAAPVEAAEPAAEESGGTGAQREGRRRRRRGGRRGGGNGGASGGGAPEAPPTAAE